MTDSTQHHRRRREHTPVLSAVHHVPHIVPKLTMMGEEDCHRLHAASCRILERTGIRVYHEPALQLFRQAGAHVDGDLVKIPADLVDAAIRTIAAAARWPAACWTVSGSTLDRDPTHCGILTRVPVYAVIL